MRINPLMSIFKVINPNNLVKKSKFKGKKRGSRGGRSFQAELHIGQLQLIYTYQLRVDLLNFPFYYPTSTLSTTYQNNAQTYKYIYMLMESARATAYVYPPRNVSRLIPPREEEKRVHRGGKNVKAGNKTGQRRRRKVSSTGNRVIRWAPQFRMIKRVGPTVSIEGELSFNVACVGSTEPFSSLACGGERRH